MDQYKRLVNEILYNGEICADRTGVGTKSIFGHQMKFDLQKGFPLLTLKKTWFKGVLHELLWMLSGDTNVKYLQDNNVKIWDEWANPKDGSLGPIYGSQWRSWGIDNEGSASGIDQIKNIISEIKLNPDSRRLIVTAWNPTSVEEGRMALPPCHILFQFRVIKGKLHCHLYQRSADVFLGVPFNIASYSTLTHMIAQVTKLQPGTFTHSIGDAHLYLNHIDLTEEMLNRECTGLPTLKLNPAVKDIDKFRFIDVTVEGYNPHPTIKAPVSV